MAGINFLCYVVGGRILVETIRSESMNIYWCYEMDEYSGLYIIEETRGKAKLRFAHETGDEYINVRSLIYRKNVDEKAGIIETEDTKLLKKYNLEYTEEETADN